MCLLAVFFGGAASEIAKIDLLLDFVCVERYGLSATVLTPIRRFLRV